MENASKALIIAGAILISILIISLGIVVFTNFKGKAIDQANMDEQEIASFNSKITPYVGQNISGSQVNALIQYVISLNTSAASKGDLTKSVKIKFPVTTSTGTETNNTIEAKKEGENFKVSYANTSYPKRVATGNNLFYEVQATYGDSGLISNITVIKNNP